MQLTVTVFSVIYFPNNNEAPAISNGIGKNPPLRRPPLRRKAILLKWRLGPMRLVRLVRRFLAICHNDKMLYIAIGAAVGVALALFVIGSRRIRPEPELELTEWQAVSTEDLSATLDQAFTRFKPPKIKTF